MCRRFWFWYVIAVAATGQAFGQDRPFLKETKVLGGRIVETFVPDLPLTPVPDPAFQQAAPQASVPTPVYQSPPQPQIYQHQNGCGCPVCQRRILSQQVRERSKTIREITTVIVVEERHPIQVINIPPLPVYVPPPRWEFVPPRPPQNSRGPYEYGQYPLQGGYAYRPQGFSLAALFGINSGVYLRSGYGYSPPPYAQSGYSYGGNHPWYGGR